MSDIPPPTPEDLVLDAALELLICKRANISDVRSAYFRLGVESWIRRAVFAEADRDKLVRAVAAHHDQKADDRCIEDDDRLYAAAGLPPCDRRVGNKESMLANCARFIDRRCENGGWPSYVELESELDRLRAEIARLQATVEGLSARVAAQ